MSQIHSRARSAFNKLKAVCGLDTIEAEAELNRRYGVSDPAKLSEKQAAEFVADMRMGAYAVADFRPVQNDETAADDEDGKPVPASTPQSRKLEIDVDAIYARWNRQKAGVTIYDHSPAAADDED